MPPKPPPILPGHQPPQPPPQPPVPPPYPPGYGGGGPARKSDLEHLRDAMKWLLERPLILAVVVPAIVVCVVCSMLAAQNQSQEKKEVVAANQNLDPVKRATEALDERDRLAKQKEAADFANRWQVVKEMFESQGATVEPWDSSGPHTMRIRLPLSMAMTATPMQAREMAGLARERLHPDAIVYIQSPSGQLLGKATPWGFE